MNNLLTFKFWIASRPPQLLPLYQNILYAVTAVFIIASFTFAHLKKKKSIYQKIYSKLFDFSVSNSIIALFILFFNLETIPFFSARLWFIIWFIEIVVWLVFIFKDFKKIPKRREEYKKEEEFKKYIP
jgi:Ca2+/Na+ antiporter